MAENQYFEISGDVLVKYTGPAAAVVVPEGVRKIQTNAFRNSGLTGILFPETLEEIGENAFFNCRSLTSVTLPSGLKKLGQRAFQETGLESLVILADLKEIPLMAFGLCIALRHVDVRGAVKIVRDGAFDRCSSLEEIRFAEGLEELRHGAFHGCDSLRRVYLPSTLTLLDRYIRDSEHYPEVWAPETCPAFDRESGLLLSRDGKRALVLRRPFHGVCRIPEGVRAARARLFEGRSDLTGVGFPESYGPKVRLSFRNCVNLRQVDFSGETIRLSEGMFQGCSALEAISLPPKLVEIPGSAFRDCAALRTVRIPESLTVVQSCAFAGCAALETFPAGRRIQFLGSGAFQDCVSLKEAPLSASLTRILEGTFRNCVSLRTAVLPETVTSVDEEAFAGCVNLAEVRFPQSLLAIRERAFAGTALETAVLPPALKYLGNEAFQGAKVRSVTVQSSLDLPSDAFDGCGLKEIVWKWGSLDEEQIGPDLSGICLKADGIRLRNVPVPLKGVLCRAFAMRSLAGEELPPEMTEMYLDYIRRRKKELWKDPPVLRIILRENMIRDTELDWYVSQASQMDARDLKALLLEYQNSHFTQEQLDRVRDGAMRREFRKLEKGKVTLTELRKIWKWSEVRDGVRIDGWKGSDGTEVTVPGTLGGMPVTQIGEHAFSPKGKTLRKEQREARENLQIIHLPDSVRVIGEAAFYGCRSLTEINLPRGVKELPGQVFWDCVSLREITIPGGVKSIGDCAFWGCCGLTRVVLENGVEKLGAYAFRCCENLDRFTLPDSLKEVNVLAFAGTHLTFEKLETPGGSVPDAALVALTHADMFL